MQFLSQPVEDQAEMLAFVETRARMAKVEEDEHRVLRTPLMPEK